MKPKFVITVFATCLLQACSFTNKPFEKIKPDPDYVKTVTDLRVGDVRIVPAGSKAYESTLFVQRKNRIQCGKNIFYRDGIAKYQILAGAYSTIGLIEVEPNKKLPFFKGAYQPGAIGGSSGMSLYFPINSDGTLYKNYYTDPYDNLSRAKGKLKEWGDNGTATDKCTLPMPHELAKISVCTVYYNGVTRENGILGSRITVDNGRERKNLLVRADNELNFCGVRIDINETTEILEFTVREIANSQ